MNNTCPHCSAPLKFSAKQQAQLDGALSKLQPGGTVKIKCPKCGGVVEFAKPEPAKAQAAPAAQSAPKAAATPKAPPKPARPKKPRKPPKPLPEGVVAPPPPPPLDWLATGELDETGRVEDVPMALLLHPEDADRDDIEEVLQNLGYQIVTGTDADEALRRMRFTQFACIVYQADMHGGLDASPFHAYMRAMNMAQRRRIFYILVGDELNTLYDLEALALSANLTVNTEELPSLPLILRKAFQNHEDLFGPFVEEMGKHMGIGG